MTAIEFVAALSGFICVYLTVKENLWCWPVGLLQVFLYIFIFYDARLYSDVILQIIYVFLQFYGWYYWLHGGCNNQEAMVTILSRAWLTAAIIIVASGTGMLGYLMASRTDASFPYADAFITACSLTAQWLLSRRKLESWYLWIAVDIVAIYVYAAKNLHLTAVLYALFLIMAFAGVSRWKQSLQKQSGVSSIVLSGAPA